MPVVSASEDAAAEDAPGPAPVAQDTHDLGQMSLEDLLSVPTVTASGGNVVQLSMASGNVKVVTRQDIDNNGWRTLAEVLDTIPGFYVTSDGSLTSIGVRGVTGGLQAGTRLVKIMINGTPVSFRPELRSFLGPEFIPIELVERIEIVKGPLSALYGANAFVGTVNVITRDPAVGMAATVTGAGIVQNKDRLGYGGSGVVAYHGERGSLLLGVTSYTLDRSGLRIQPTFPGQDPTSPRFASLFAGPSQRDLANPGGAFLEVVVPTEHAGTFTLDGGIQHLDANAEFHLNSVLTHQSRESLINAWSNLRYEKSWSDSFSSQINAGFSSGQPLRDDRLYLTGVPSQTFTRNFGYRAFDSSLVVNYAPSPQFSARLGVDADIENQDILFYSVTFATAQGNTPAGQTTDLLNAAVSKRRTLSDFGVDLQLTGSPISSLPDLQLTGNARIDRVAYAEFQPPAQWSFRGAAVYRWTPWLITKLIGGRAFQAPSGVLMFAQSGFGIANNVIGNLTPASSVPPLRPQTLTSVEGVAYLSFSDKAVLEAAGFIQKMADKIEFVTAGTDYVARNSGETNLRGVEASLQTTLGRVNPFFSGAWVTSADDQPIVAYPELVGAAGADVVFVEKPRLALDVRYRWVGKRRANPPNEIYNSGLSYSLPAYGTADLTVSCKGLPILGKDSHTDVFASIHNLLDERHSEPGFGGFDVPAPGRTMFLEIRQSF